LTTIPFTRRTFPSLFIPVKITRPPPANPPSQPLLVSLSVCNRRSDFQTARFVPIVLSPSSRLSFSSNFLLLHPIRTRFCLTLFYRASAPSLSPFYIAFLLDLSAAHQGCWLWSLRRPTFLFRALIHAGTNPFSLLCSRTCKDCSIIPFPASIFTQEKMLVGPSCLNLSFDPPRCCFFSLSLVLICSPHVLCRYLFFKRNVGFASGGRAPSGFPGFAGRDTPLSFPWIGTWTPPLGVLESIPIRQGNRRPCPRICPRESTGNP